MHPLTVFTKTSKGVLEVRNKTIKLSRDLNQIFLLVDGKSTVADMQKAKSVLEGMVKQIPGVLSDPPPTIAVSELGDSSVNLVVRPHCHPDNYWDVFFATVEGSKRALDEAGIPIPFPQRDVHLYQAK